MELTGCPNTWWLSYRWTWSQYTTTFDMFAYIAYIVPVDISITWRRSCSLYRHLAVQALNLIWPGCTGGRVSFSFLWFWSAG
jgi:hypothetical protein